jgi:predicted ATPase
LANQRHEEAINGKLAIDMATTLSAERRSKTLFGAVLFSIAKNSVEGRTSRAIDRLRTDRRQDLLATLILSLSSLVLLNTPLVHAGSLESRYTRFRIGLKAIRRRWNDIFQPVSEVLLGVPEAVTGAAEAASSLRGTAEVCESSASGSEGSVPIEAARDSS